MKNRNVLFWLTLLLAIVLVGGVVWSKGKEEPPPPQPAEPEAEAAEPAAEAEPAEEPAPVRKPGEYGEAPMLKAAVALGQIPPVKERLPENPLVAEQAESIGRYCDTWTRWGAHFRVFAWEPLVKMDIDGSLHPNIAESWEISDDKTMYTFYLRKGIKWSDGHPYTTQDIMFWWDDVVNYEEMTRFKSSLAQEAEVSAPDDYTLVIKFNEPFPQFMAQISIQWGGYGFTFASFPKHYLSTLHPKYTGKATLDALVKEEGVDDWVLLFDAKYYVENNPDIPVLTPWRIITKSSDTVQIAERNPYYWKIDAAGNQLPYFDKMMWPTKAEREVGLLKVMSGELDFASGMSFDTQDMPMLYDYADEGGYTIQKVEKPYNPTYFCLFVNQNYQGDPEVADVLRNLKFREALSVAIDREELNEFMGLGQCEPVQATVPASHPAGSEELRYYMTQFDPDLANKLLDEAGLTNRDSEGFRTLPSGKKFTLVVSPRVRPQADEIMKPHFEDVGVRVNISVEESSFWFQNKNSGMHMISQYGLGNGNPELRDTWWIPINQNAYWAPMNGLYESTGGAQGDKPTGDIAEIIAKYRQFQGEPNDAKRLELLKWVVDKITRNLYMIGTISRPPEPIVVGKHFHNVPKEIIEYTTRMPVWEYAALYMDPR